MIDFLIAFATVLAPFGMGWLLRSELARLDREGERERYAAAVRDVAAEDARWTP